MAESLGLDSTKRRTVCRGLKRWPRGVAGVLLPALDPAGEKGEYDGNDVDIFRRCFPRNLFDDTPFSAFIDQPAAFSLPLDEGGKGDEGLDDIGKGDTEPDRLPRPSFSSNPPAHKIPLLESIGVGVGGTGGSD